MSEQTRQLVLRLRQRLQAVIRRITFAEMAFGLVLLLGACSAYWVVSVALEAGFWLDVTPRAILFWGGVVLLGGLFVYFLLLPLLRLTGLLPGLSEEQVARRIGAHYPEVSDRLVNVLHLASGRHSDAPAPLIDGAVRMLTEQVQHVPFEQVERFERARRAARLATAPVLLLLVFLVAAPSTFVDASKRLLSPGVAFEKPAPFSFVVEPGSVELVRGASLEVVVHVRGSARPAQVHLVLNYPGEEAVQALPLTPDSTGAYRHTLVNVRRTLRYRVAAGHVESPWHTVTVAERPLVRGLQVQLDFPAYTRLPARRLEPNVGDVTALPGTEVSVEVGTGGENVTEAFLRFDDGTLDTLSLDGAVAAGSFILHREGSYQVLLRNARGVENADPIAYQLRLLPDAEPTVVLLAPPPLADLNEQRQALLRLRIADDFGFTRLRLYYRLAESRFGQTGDAFHALELPRPGPHTLDQEIEYPWDLRATTGLDLVPGDVVEYYVAVWDNDTVAGYKSARTPSQRLRFPSLAEQYERLHEQENDIEETIETLREEADQVRRQFEELRDALRRKPEAGWEEQRQLEQLQERQQRLEQRVEELTSELDAATRQMEENNLVSEETLELFQELQEVAEEIRSPELMEALRQLQEAIQNMNLQQMQQALENFDFNEVQYRQRLERTLELFKQLRLQQGLEEVARRAGELARQEERLAEETGKLLEAKEDREAKDNRQADEARETNRPQETSREPQETGAERDTTGNAPENRDTRQEAKETGAPPSRQEQLAREQERAREEMEALQERLKTLQEQMQEVKNAPKQEFQQLNQQLEQQDLPRQMQRNAEQLRQNQLQPARQGQQQMQQQLQQMQQQLQQMQQNMQGQQLQLNLAGLRRALSDILTLSQQQETLRGEVRGLAADSPLLRRYAQDQVVLSEGLSVVTDSLRSLARNIPQMTREVQRHAGEALREMGAATEAMAERVARRATEHQKGAMTHLNELALLLSDLLNQLMNSMSGMSSNMSMQQMIQQFQQMAQQQQQLNEQIQQLLNDMQGNRLVQDMQERLRQLAGQQEQIRNQLKQFSRNREFRNEILGDLNHIAEQMEETIRELQQQRVNRRTIERQQQILTRLLDATRSLQERGKEKRRESRTGEDVPRESPGTLTPREQAEKLRRDLLRALESGYAPDYEVLIKRYFELLQQMSRED
ncbi:chromosome partitioning protein ParA [Rhodocaloribacter litoris]|uniref:DUF4175 family protein n=1 Tax=Rhodocaloribacter litoris TaxID=2558931 RepID=UPI0014237B1B|nr:DUF4175 family protein [Rhodocaloribacter litoris]QXD15665.1 chromosome partitioning protein ParA [Rhodocaloribacter litoris]